MDERLAIGERLTVVVLGKPAPGGSKSMVPSPHSPTGFAIRPSSKRTEPWMKICEANYRSAWGDAEPLDCPVAVYVTFFYAPPKTVRDATLWPMKTGDDLDKLLRATLDPLAGAKGRKVKDPWPGIISNDRRIVRIVAERRFGTPERAEVEVERLDPSSLDEEPPWLGVEPIPGEMRLPFAQELH